MKTVLANELGAIVPKATRELAVSHAPPLRSEQDPDACVDTALASSTISLPRTRAKPLKSVELGVRARHTLRHYSTRTSDRGARPSSVTSPNPAPNTASLSADVLHSMPLWMILRDRASPPASWYRAPGAAIFARAASLLMTRAWARCRLATKEEGYVGRNGNALARGGKPGRMVAGRHLR
jgi:hypothetical protein